MKNYTNINKKIIYLGAFLSGYKASIVTMQMETDGFSQAVRKRIPSTWGSVVSVGNMPGNSGLCLPLLPGAFGAVTMSFHLGKCASGVGRWEGVCPGVGWWEGVLPSVGSL